MKLGIQRMTKLRQFILLFCMACSVATTQAKELPDFTNLVDQYGARCC